MDSNPNTPSEYIILSHVDSGGEAQSLLIYVTGGNEIGQQMEILGVRMLFRFKGENVLAYRSPLDWSQ